MNIFVGGYFIVKGFVNDGIRYIPHNYFTVSDCISDFNTIFNLDGSDIN